MRKKLAHTSISDDGQEIIVKYRGCVVQRVRIDKPILDEFGFEIMGAHEFCVDTALSLANKWAIDNGYNGIDWGRNE